MNCYPKTWSDVAINVLAGGYDKADRSTRESIIIGLRTLDTAEARDALRKLGHDKPF